MTGFLLRGVYSHHLKGNNGASKSGRFKGVVQGASEQIAIPAKKEVDQPQATQRGLAQCNTMTSGARKRDPRSKFQQGLQRRKRQQKGGRERGHHSHTCWRAWCNATRGTQTRAMCGARVRRSRRMRQAHRGAVRSSWRPRCQSEIGMRIRRCDCLQHSSVVWCGKDASATDAVRAPSRMIHPAGPSWGDHHHHRFGEDSTESAPLPL